MNIIFLDVDGVLNNDKTWLSLKERRNSVIASGDSFKMCNEYMIDEDLVKLLSEVTKKCSAKIVLSSTWRLLDKDYESIVSICKKHGCEVIGRTPELWSIRGEEIQEWILENDHIVSKYAILDDNSDMLEEQKPHFFKTDSHVGLTNEIANNIIKHFNK